MAEPSRLVLLNQIHILDLGTKVRFLGWSGRQIPRTPSPILTNGSVHSYDGQSATLVLKDYYPAIAGDAPSAFVNISNVLDSVQYDVLEVGAWLNVMGYIRRNSGLEPQNQRMTSKVYGEGTAVDATMVWSAGAIKLDRYQAAVRDYQMSGLAE